LSSLSKGSYRASALGYSWSCRLAENPAYAPSSSRTARGWWSGAPWPASSRSSG